MLDRYAKEKYDIASSLLDEIKGEDIRVLLLEITIEASKQKLFQSEMDFSMSYDSNTLKRLAESLLFRIVYDENLTNAQKESAALVCAYAYETLCPPLQDGEKLNLEDYGYLNRIISALLYYLAGYDPNAKSITDQLDDFINQLNVDGFENIILKQLFYFAKFSMSQVKVEVEPPEVSNLKGFNSLNEICRQACLFHLINCLNELSEEFCFKHSNWNEGIKEKLVDLISNARDCGQETIMLLGSLLVLFEELLKDRAISTLKRPTKCDSIDWKNQMERYIDDGIYLIWPPHRDAISKGLLEEKTNNIVAIPTGTGKSLIAEHKIISYLQTGALIIYLAPTLALCRQINYNMNKIMDIHKQGKGSSVLIEDADLLGDKIPDTGEDLILVMTPEKCVSIIANNIDLVKRCTLCVVDEFHSIFDGSRGALLDLLLSRISQLSKASFLIMSALIESSYELENWLYKLNGHKLGITDTKWRPTKTIRGFVSHPEDELNRAKTEAENTGKSTYKTNLATQLYFCVQDVWSGNKKEAYPLPLPIKMEVRFKKVKNQYDGRMQWRVDGYGNDMARQLGNYLCSCDMPVLIFSQGTRHLLTEINKHEKIGVFPQNLTRVTKAYLTLANIELGYESELMSGLANGIGIHTQALIDEEQLAVEDFFRKSSNGILCATGTISQGLNLAAAAVIVNTTKQYNEENSKSLRKSEVINMLGRAGRPGFGFQSIGIIVPQYPSTTTDSHFNLDEESTAYLERVDGVEEVNSGLFNIFDEIARKELNEEGLDDDFTLITNVLGASSAQNRKDMLKKTLATQFLEDTIMDNVFSKWSDWLVEDQTPEKVLILKAAVKSANKANVVEALLKTIDENEVLKLFEKPQDDFAWLDWLQKCLSKLSTEFIQENIHELFTDNEVMIRFIDGWINGFSIINLAKILNEHGIGSFKENNVGRSDRTSVAKAIKIIREGIRNISHITTAYIALVDFIVNPEEFEKKELPNNFIGLSNYLKFGVLNEKAIVLRKLHFPREIANKLSMVILSEKLVISAVNKWKSTKEIDELSLNKELEDALISIIK